MRIISQKFRNGPRIISDMWWAHQNLSYNNIYEEVNHSLNFVDPTDPNMRTQNLKYMWNHAKKQLRVHHDTTKRLF